MSRKTLLALRALLVALDLCAAAPGVRAAILAGDAAMARETTQVAAKPTTSAAQGNDEDAIKGLEREWEQAIVRRDIGTLRRLMHPDFVLVGATAAGGPSTVTLETWLDNLVNKMKLYSFSAPVTRVRVYGDTAVVSVDGAWKIEFAGRPVDDHFFLTDVWARQDGIWRAVLRHSSRYQPAPSPPARQ